MICNHFFLKIFLNPILWKHCQILMFSSDGACFFMEPNNRQNVIRSKNTVRLNPSINTIVDYIIKIERKSFIVFIPLPLLYHFFCLNTTSGHRGKLPAEWQHCNTQCFRIASEIATLLNREQIN